MVVGFLWHMIWSFIDVVTSPWRNLIWFSLWLYCTFWRMVFTAASTLINAPLRILEAVRRDHELKAEVYKLQLHCEQLKKAREESNIRLEFVLKDRKRLKESLDHAWKQLEMSVERLKSLKTRVQELEYENLHLKALKHDKMATDKIVGTWKTTPLEYTDDQMHNTLVATIHKPCFEDGKEIVKQQFEDSLHADVYSDKLDDIWHKGRDVAMVSSIFSALLSSIVGVVIHEAQDSCMPLVIASVIVVGMSLKNVIKFFSKLQDKFGSEAVGLLSFNCFMLGILTFPAFPRITSLLALILMESGKWVASCFK